MVQRLFGTVVFLSLFFSKATAQTCDLINESFETATTANPVAGWTHNGCYIGTSFPNTGNKHAGFNTQGDEMIVAATACPNEICFWWRASGTSSDYDMDIDWSSDNGATWNNVHSINLLGSGSPTSYSQTCVNLPANSYSNPCQNVLIRFHQSRRNSGSFYLDDVCVSSVPVPTQLIFSDLQNGCLEENTPFSVKVCASNGSGTTSVTYSDAITVSGSGLSGTTTLSPTNGCAVFTDLNFATAGNYTLSANSNGLSGMLNNVLIQADCPTTETLKIMSYNLLQFPNSTSLCSSPIVIPDRTDTLAIITTYVQPDVLMVCELQTETGANMILNNALNINGITKYARASWKMNGSPGGTSLNNGFFYNSDKLTFYAQDEIPTDVRDINVYTMYANDPNLASHQDTTFIDFYVAHLKAGNGASEQMQRQTECQAIQNYINNQANDHNAIIGGDFNFYDSAEAGYQLLLSGSYPFYDPINLPGAWDNNGAFAGIHTQSTRAFGDPNYDCGATGGMDSRFDFLLTSNSILNGLENVEYIADSYDNLGNNGTTFNKAINAPDNTIAVPRNVLSALYYMSDHLPIIMDAQVTYPQILPVDLTYFSAELRHENVIELHWEGEENNVNNYEIERSYDGLYFEQIGIQKAGETSYNFIDYDFEKNDKEIYFRLKINDLDGTFSYSKLKVVQLLSSDFDVTIYPNPSRGVIHIESDIIENRRINLVCYNHVGQLLFQQEKILENTTVDLREWGSGVYWIVLKNEHQIVRKMILVQ